MNTCHICNKTANNLPIRLGQFPLDEKAAYIESVLDVMLESRFGPAYSYAYLERPNTAADEPYSFLDLIEQEHAVWYASEYLLQTPTLQRRSTGRVLPGQNPARSKGIPRGDTLFGRNIATLVSGIPISSPANLGRGSPSFQGRTIFC